MIPLFISSKNRPSQLRLLLESIGVNTNSLFDITVLYKYDSSGYKLGYEKLKEEKILSNLTFVEEEQGVNGNFLNQMREYITSAGKLFSLMVDDNIVYRNIDATTEEIEEQFTDDVFCVSLRLGKNTTVANHLKPHIETPLQEFQKTSEKFIKWDWTGYESDSGTEDFSSYGLPFTWDGGVYRSEEILNIIENSVIDRPDMQRFPLPHKMEKAVNNFTIDNQQRRFLASPTNSCVIGTDYNKVINTEYQGGYKFKGDKKGLNDLYLRNFVIDLNSINFSDVKSTHDEIPFELRKLL